VKDGWINGAVGLIARDGKIIYYKATGYDDLETKEPLKREGIFRIASQTKQSPV
jgi:CubicO group peptidase (beta-lactamase class C family)